MRIDLFIFLTLCVILLFSCSETEHVDKSVETIDEKVHSKLIFEKTKIEIKNVKRGEVIEGIYTFKNTGENVLTIEYVNPDCTCTSYEVSSNKVLPGQEGWVKLVLDTKDKLPETRINATVRTNTDQRFHRLVLKASIID